MISNKVTDKYKRIIPIPKKAVMNDEVIQLGNDWSVAADGSLEVFAQKFIANFQLSPKKDSKAITLNIITDLEE